MTMKADPSAAGKESSTGNGRGRKAQQAQASPEGQTPRPVALHVVPENIPAELTSVPNWVGWRYVWAKDKRGGGRWTKPPLRSDGGGPAKTNDPGTWSPFEAAVAAYNAGEFDGIGLVLPEGMTGIDIDGPAHLAALRPLKTYTERSPTEGKDAYHAFLFGKKPPGAACKKGEAEAYDWGRYLTVTGHRVDGAPDRLSRPSARVLAGVLRKLGLLDAPAPPTPPPAQPPPPPVSACPPCPPPPDKELLEKMFSCPSNGAKIRALWDGDTSGYPSPSEADMALCGHLAFWTDRDPAAIDRLFRQSVLFREDKWKRPIRKGGETYGAKTVRTAVANSRRGYTGTRPQPNGEADRADRRTQEGGAAAPAEAPPASPAAGANGEPPPEPASPRAGANGQLPPDGPGPGANGGGSDGPVPGVLASDLEDAKLEWFLPPWVPRRRVTLLTGRKGTGKSTLTSFAISVAQRSVVLPAFEEEEGDFKDRLAALGVPLGNVRVLKDPYHLPQQGDALLRAVRHDRPELLVIDRVQSYLDPGLADGLGTDVRKLLEWLAGLASEYNLAVLGIVHPGKAKGNDIKGTGEWENTPRYILKLQKSSPRSRAGVLSAIKYGARDWPPDARYELVTAANGGAVFRLVGPAAPCEADLLDDLADPAESLKAEAADALLRGLLENDRQDAAYVLRRGRDEGIGETTMRKMARHLGVNTGQREGSGREHKSYWKRPDVWPAKR